MAFTETTHGMWMKGDSEPQLLISVGQGEIIHCRTDGTFFNPKMYLPSINASPSVVTSIAVYPLDDTYFIAGCNDGFIRFGKNLILQ